MDKTLELVLAIMSAVFVLYTAVIDPKAAMTVALVAIICLVAYRMMFNKKTVKKTVIIKKSAPKKISKSKKKK